MRKRDLPSGTVTFLFTDVEGSTKLLHEVGPDAYASALADHRRRIRAACSRHAGVEVDTQGDALFVAFPDAAEAVAAATEAQEALATGPIRVRMGLHTGTPLIDEAGYVGADVHQAARIAAAGHGGQILLSKRTHGLVDVDATDLGEHRLKDFAEPVWIFQVGSERFPPLKTISNTNLPRPASSFVGREREVQDVASMVRQTRFVTLTGPGGSGKTRLAIEAAASLVPEFRNGVFWTGLAPLRDPSLVLESVAKTLGAADDLVEGIGDREMLLLLDNLEQVVEAAPGLAALVEACPNLHVLVTSRERLRVRGEVEFVVPPLAEREAVQLFQARSGLEPQEMVAELCRRLDNLPLAVELAAARTSVLTPAQILERLSGRLDLLRGGRDAEARQQTLRATIAWSHDLLHERERRLFARLAIFRGGCTAKTAEQVAEADLDVLESLVDKSLLRHTDDRFWMLETVRDYASERLEASGEAPMMRQRHAELFLSLAEEAEPNLLGARTDAWHDRLEREHDNLRAALDHLEASGQIEAALRLAGAVQEFWDQRGHQVEGLHRYQRLLELDGGRTRARAKALDGASMLATKTGDVSAATRWGEEALSLHVAVGDRRGTANSQWQLGYLSLEAGDLNTAERSLRESVDTFRELGDEGSELWASRTLAFTYYRMGDLGRARSLYEDTLGRARARGDAPLQGAMLGALANIAVDEGRAEDALSVGRESLRLSRDLADPILSLSGICSIARVLAMLGRATAAARLLGHAEVRFEETGTREPWVDRLNAETRAAIEGRVGATELSDERDRGRQLSPDQAFALALEALA